MLIRATTWLTILRISLEERLVYRGDFALGTLMRFLPLVTQIFLWQAVFAAMAVSVSGGHDIAGYTFRDMIVYYLLTTIGRAFSSMPGLASGIARDIRDGTVKKYLVQPIDMLGFLFLGRIAHKLVYYGVAMGPFVSVFYLCRGFFSGWPDATTMIAFTASLVMAFLLGLFPRIDHRLDRLLVSRSEFALVRLHAFQFFLARATCFHWTCCLAGWVSWCDCCLRREYLAYSPAAIFLGKITGAELVRALVIQFAWVVFFFGASRVAFHYGARRYAGYGG